MRLGYQNRRPDSAKQKVIWLGWHFIKDFQFVFSNSTGTVKYTIQCIRIIEFSPKDYTTSNPFLTSKKNSRMTCASHRSIRTFDITDYLLVTILISHSLLFGKHEHFVFSAVFIDRACQPDFYITTNSRTSRQIPATY